MIEFDVEADVRRASRFMSDIERKVLPRVVVGSLNDVIKTGRASASREIRHFRRLKIGTIKGELKIEKATRQHWAARIRSKGKPISLKEYGAKRSGRGGRYITVNITGRRTRLQTSPPAFIADTLGGHVFQRVNPAPGAGGRPRWKGPKNRGPGRLPIRKLFGPSIPSTLAKPAVDKAVRRAMAEAWPKRFTARMDLALRRLPT